MIGLTVLGSTGSIGLSTLDVVARHPDLYRIVALSANRNLEQLYQQCLLFQPDYAVLAEQSLVPELKQRLHRRGVATRVLGGVEGLQEIASLDSVDYVMAAIVGAAGLLPVLAAARAGKRILLANKEALVVAGSLFMQEVVANAAEVLPIDSEHNAVFQCMPPRHREGLVPVGVRRILLTASGGPFRTAPLEQLEGVTPEQACAHPNWAMGRKISVDSATMMNKGLEVIEACWLFNTEADRIDVVVHPQSVIHSLVEYVDGSVLAQLGNPDMRTPIAHALAWPERIESGVASLDLCAVARLDFEQPDLTRFPCLRLAYQSITAGRSAPAVLNAANEVAVATFLQRRMSYTAIPEVVERTLEQIPPTGFSTLTELLEIDSEARRQAEQIARTLV
ncbi:MAG: 1-deoxy-D-xylulose-5-phosphate reductoisomerase [Gammaproteobacteria bacterium]|nr:1-deoxy-D-xylulose-5-phosphate reductoisomerase [Gammaproteobacteria bacterium]MCP5416554.1 1-deoxy-D-xylulose-5-phosphate reductoisomerase [Chromatiaceae bacterium]